MAFKARVLKHSITEQGHPIMTMEWTFPRIILAELNTHRMLSRNAASSRAIPIQKMLKRVWNDPFVPVWWGKNQAGMQAKEELTGVHLALAKLLWVSAGRLACVVAWLMMKVGIHKQIANRVVEPWSWTTVIITATEWSNLFALRTHPDAQPEFQKIARMAKEAYDASVPTLLKPGEWHLPLVDDVDQLRIDGFSKEQIVKVCTGRCARVSYLTHDGKRDPKADIELAERLQLSGHMSPWEHPAMAPTVRQNVMNNGGQFWSGNIFGWQQARKTLRYEADFGSRPKAEHVAGKE